MKGTYYGVFGVGVWQGLVTPDKQLHSGPSPIFGREKDFFFYAAGLINFLERECPKETFTIVIDEFEAFKNNHWRNGPDG